MEKVLKIEGMMCNHCVMHVQKALATVFGAEKVSVNREDKSARIKQNQYVLDDIFKKAVRDQGMS